MTHNRPIDRPVDPYEPTTYCHECSLMLNRRDLVMGRFCSRACMRKYDRNRSRRRRSGDDNSTTPTRPRTGGLIGF